MSKLSCGSCGGDIVGDPGKHRCDYGEKIGNLQCALSVLFGDLGVRRGRDGVPICFGEVRYAIDRVIREEIRDYLYENVWYRRWWRDFKAALRDPSSP